MGKCLSVYIFARRACLTWPRLCHQVSPCIKLFTVRLSFVCESNTKTV